MLSATLLLTVWALFLNCFNLKTRETNSGHSDLLWSILFGCSLATASSIYLLQINLLPSIAANQWALKLELAASFLYLIYAFSKKSLVKKLISPFRREYKATKLLIATGMTFLFVFTMFTSAPLNWDSNAYNVARISTFLSDASSILEPSTASARQAIYAVGHDILLYPDLSFGILRGLPLVSLLEFVVILGTLFGIVNTFSKTALADTPIALKAAGLITTVLLFNSHQQVMQALITKNDLAITLLFTIAIATGLAYLFKQQKPFSDELTMSALFLMLCTAINVKSYGIILMIPTALTSIVVIRRRQLANQTKGMAPNSSDPSSLHKLLIILGISTLIAFSIQTSLVNEAWVDTPGNRVNSITSAWTNQKGSWAERLENSFINSGRILLQGSLFPYTTLKPYLPIGVDLKSPINDSIIPEVLQGYRGSASGPFTLLYGTNPDMAYPFFGFQIGLILGLLGWCLRSPQKGLAGAVFIMLSSGLTFLFFSSALLYQPWISRFMGPVYIPLIPVAAIGIFLVLQKIHGAFRHQQILERPVSQVCAFVLGILPLVSSMSLSGYLSRREGMPQGKSDFYNEYLLSQKGLKANKAKELIRKLKANSFSLRYLCGEDGAWTLVPMILSQSNSSHVKKNVHLLNENLCSEKIFELSGNGNAIRTIKTVNLDGIEFIHLP